MAQANPFVLPKEAYQRDINFIGHYVDDQASYLSTQTGKPFETCKAFVLKQIKKGGKFEFKDPRIAYSERGENGDRHVTEGTLWGYIKEAIREKDLLAPTFTTYLSPKKKLSPLVAFIDRNVKARGMAKKAQFDAEMSKNFVLAAIKQNEQNNKKIANNSISGAHVSPSTPLYNKTAHSTLTSNCRSTSGFGNANNEKLLSGNRHYWSYQITINNLVSIVNHTDYTAFALAMDKYSIKHPSVDDVMDCLLFSTRLYWRSPVKETRLRTYVSKLTPIQRAAIVYTGDMYHLAKHNPEVVRDFIKGISTRATEPVENPDQVIHSYPEEDFFLAIQVCEDFMKGVKPKDAKLHANYGILAATVKGIGDTVEKYADLISAFWRSSNVPASLAHFPDSIRRAALTSDTDSTIFTVQDWVEWYFGDVIFTPEANAVAASMIWLSAKTITHILARMSANFGIETERIHQVAMKNEFKFDVFVPTQVAKHYFALIGCQEGNLFDKYKTEIKGVHLRSSNAPRWVMAQAEDLMIRLMKKVLAGEKISINEVMKEVGDVERKLFESIRNGSSLRMGQIKSPDSYTQEPSVSNYRFYTFWNETFGVKYGEIPPPPYISVKVTTNIDSARKTLDWLEAMEDKELASRIRGWMERNNKKYIGSVLLPAQIVSNTGIPPELLAAVDIRRMVADLVKVYYLILETLGVYIPIDNKVSRLVSDTH